MMGKHMIKINTSKADVQILFFCLIISMGLPTLLFAQTECPQQRETPTAPKEILAKKNPLRADSKNIKSGEALFQKQVSPITCKTCHGVKGDGKSEPGFESAPPARNFRCAKTMEALTDG